jgi:glycosyltransferase involved in cell wall biosynthesis
MKILALTNSTASPWWRFFGIARNLNEHGHEMAVIKAQNWRDDVWCGADIVIGEMIYNEKLVDFVHNNGAKFIYEVDDLIDKTDRKNLSQKEENVELFRNVIRRADAVTVTTKPLAEIMKKLNKNVFVLDNYMDEAWWKKETRHKRNDGQVRLLWAGGKTHFEDLRMVAPVISKLVKKYDFLRFIYCGYGGMSSEKGSTEAGWGEDVFFDISRENREYYLGVDPNLWPRKLQMMDADIAIAPLIRDRFNEAKSNIKWQEYSWCGIPGVYSPTVYSETVKHGVDGYIAETLNEWEHYLEKLILSEDVRREVAKTAQETVLRDWMLEDRWREWEKVYSDTLK